MNPGIYGSPHNPSVYRHSQEHPFLIGCSLNDQGEPIYVKMKHLNKKLKSLGAIFQPGAFNATAWCKLHDLKPHQFNYYLYKDKPQNQRTAPAAARWLSVEIEDSATTPDQTSLLVKVGEATIEVKPGFDPALLCQLVKTLSA